MTTLSRCPPLGPEVLHDLDRALSIEWIETNGIGGFASSTITRTHTRRYHGLLVAALAPPVARHNMLTSLDVAVAHGGRDHFLSCHLYPDTVYPSGHLTLERFELAPFPRWTHHIAGGLTVIHELWMDPDKNTTVLIWRLPQDQPHVTLTVTPLVALRDFHTLTRRAAEAPGFDDLAEGRVTIRPHAPMVSALHLHHSPASVHTTGRWYRKFQLPTESARGEDDVEDLWNSWELTFDLAPDQPAVLVASTDEVQIADPIGFAEASLQRRLGDEERMILAHPTEEPMAWLAPAVRAFRVERADGRPTIIAGHHWFADWGRDTMIALPGLFLVHGHTAEAMATLRTWFGFLDEGMLPNRFPDFGEPPEYNTVDAALWCAAAVLRTWQCLGGRGSAGLVPTGNPWAPPPLPAMADLSNAEASFLHEALAALDQIIAAHREGTRHGIRMDSDGLITQGAPALPLTWMDARWKRQVFTPRRGKPIEVQALWFNTLCTAALLRRAHGDTARAAELEELATQVRRAVAEAFWADSTGCLCDVIRPDGSPDESIRPNQIFTVSLPFACLEPARAADVLGVVEGRLLTPFGLRTLDPFHPKYQAHCEGSRAERDAAYHQGTVWPWLIGPFVDASLRVRGATREVADGLRRSLDPLLDHACHEAGRGQVSEIFDGEPPHTPRGCIAQAWSVAELLRVLWTLSLVR